MRDGDGPEGVDEVVRPRGDPCPVFGTLRDLIAGVRWNCLALWARNSPAHPDPGPGHPRVVRSTLRTVVMAYGDQEYQDDLTETDDLRISRRNTA